MKQCNNCGELRAYLNKKGVFSLTTMNLMDGLQLTIMMTFPTLNSPSLKAKGYGAPNETNTTRT